MKHMDDIKLKGVNLGGWLVVEKWMTPRLFAGTDAEDMYELAGTKEGGKRLEDHFKTFIQESDFRWLRDNGLNAVRIPVGYWLFDGDGPYAPVITHLDRAVKLAKKYDLKVLIDLHAAPGSQNGHNHSGKSGVAQWYKDSAYQEQTIIVLEELAKRYYDEPHIWGIELLNEPKLGLFQFTLRSFYRRAYERLVKVVRPGTRIVFSDAFTPRLMSGALRRKASHPVVMDIHWYHFSYWLYRWRSLDAYFHVVSGRMKLIRRLTKTQPVIIGEWSVVLAAKSVHGTSKSEAEALFRRHAAVQLVTFGVAEGWFYWTYKTQDRGIWHFRSLVEDGILVIQ
jgi:glucan 1,3-beta-glucosidase